MYINSFIHRARIENWNISAYKNNYTLQEIQYHKSSKRREDIPCVGVRNPSRENNANFFDLDF